MNKRAVLGDGMILIYQFVLVTIISVFILGLSGLSYNYFIDVSDSSATLFAKDLLDCLAPNGYFDVDYLADSEVFGCSVVGSENYYFVLRFYDSGGISLLNLSQGDSSIQNVYNLYREVGSRPTAGIAQYEPGRVFLGLEYPYYPVDLIYEGERIKGGMYFDVYSGDEI